MKRRLRLERCLGVLNLGHRRLVYEPVDLSRCDGTYPRCWETLLGPIQYRHKRVRFPFSTSDESNTGSVVNDGICQRNSLRWGFRAVGNISHPSVFLCEQFVAGEEGCGVSVGTYTEEDEIEDGETRSVLLSELVDEFFLVRIGELFDIVGKGIIDRVDVLRRDGDFAEEFGDAEAMVGVFVVERDNALICIVDLPIRTNTQGEIEGESGSMVNTLHAIGSREVTDHLSHFTPGLLTSPPSCFGSDPPEIATVNLPFFSIDSF